MKNNLNEIVNLLEKSKGNDGFKSQILDVIQKLTDQVQEVKGDLNLLKVVNKNSTVESKSTEDLSKTTDNSKLKEKIINFVEVANNALKQNTKKISKEFVVSNESTEKVEQVQTEQVQVTQIQQILKSLSSVIQSTYEMPVTINQENELNPINIEKLVGIEKLPSETKSILKNNLSEIVNLLEKSKVSNDIPPQILGGIQKLTTEVNDVKGNLALLKTLNFQSVRVNSEEKSIEDNSSTEVNSLITKTASEISPKNQMQSSSDAEREINFQEIIL